MNVVLAGINRQNLEETKDRLEPYRHDREINPGGV
jgi:hypothetical protein